ncbi:MAG: molybdopterin molybdotransferase MoeA [Anaerolineaceae bacterium]|nr:molybdopterin molybdotransferase MoeA [Anaerolineaceae bacterium]
MEKLLSVEAAKKIILEKAKIKEGSLFPLHQSHGRILSQDIYAEINLPSFDNSSMDGFAVIAKDVMKASHQDPVELEIIEDIAAGSDPKLKVYSGQASRIMTGAPMPFGSNAVVPVEFTNFSDRYAQQALPKTILVNKTIKPGDYIRPQGQDIQIGEKLFSKSHKLRAQDLGVLAAQGIDKVPTIQQPLVALLSSGDELIQPGEVLHPGKIYDSNSITIKTLIESFGAKVVDLGVAKDNYLDIKEKFQKITDLKFDLIVSTAGVSVGVYDYIRDVILEDGSLNFWRVNIRPGKPLTFGEYKSVPYFGLPGNPVSAFVSALIFIKPYINQLLGLSEEIILNSAILKEDLESDGRESYLRAKIDHQEGTYFAKLASHQGSGNIFSLVYANALLIIPAGVKSVPKGKPVKFFWI